MNNLKKLKQEVANALNDEITTVEEAKDFLKEKANLNVEEISYKYIISDKSWDDEANEYIETDEELIAYANQTKEEME